MRKATQRKYDILRAYLVATGGHLPEDIGELLNAMQELVPGVSELETREAIRWALRQPPRPKTPHQPSRACARRKWR